MTDEEFALLMAKAHVAEFEVRVAQLESALAMLTGARRSQEAEEARHALAAHRETLDLARDRLRHLQEASVRG